MTIPTDRVENVFNALIECATDQRTTLGEMICASDKTVWREVKSLLNAADNAKGFLSSEADSINWQTTQILEPDLLLGKRLGAYEIVKELDSGGMGVVYLANRVDGHYQQQVAIKMIRIGCASDIAAQRFNAERQFLAHLQHSNIAQLLDGGTSADGYPYLVMEYIQGKAIDSYCISNQLTVEKILLLVRQVCIAVHYAHQNLVVHCDLKPTNILVTPNGEPKLLDFGIAKLLRPTSGSPSSTNADMRGTVDDSVATLFTPEFAAPEQLCDMPVTTATDIYSLGVVLYRLLTGKAPYKFSSYSLQDIINTVTNIDIPPPSAVAPQAIRKQLSGDLDNLVLKALQQDPAQRYSSVQAFANDIDRFLTGHPISASRLTWLYRSTRYIRRNRLWLCLSVLAIASLLAGSMISTWQWQFARKKQTEAEYNFREIQKLSSNIIIDIPKSIAELPGSTQMRERMIRKGVTYLDNLAKIHIDNSQLQLNLATAYHELAKIQGMPMMANLGDPELALSNFQKAIAIQERLLVETPEDRNLILKLAASYMFAGGLYGASFGNLDQGHDLAEKCLTLVQPFADSRNAKVIMRLIACYTAAAHWRTLHGHPDLATQHLQLADQLYSNLSDDHPFINSLQGHRLRTRIHEEWAEVEMQKGNPEKALQHERRRLDIALSHLQNHDSANRIIGRSYHGLAARLATTNRLIEAREAYELAIAQWKIWQHDHPVDVSGILAITVIQGELADLLWKSASSASKPAVRTQLVKKSCASYADSVRNLESLPDSQTSFPTRYAWSPDPDTIVKQHSDRCR